MEQGWVYVLVNSSMPGMAKVGRTTRAPAERASELSTATGVATPFVVAFDQTFEDCFEAERLIHAELDRRGLRVAPNREFFFGAPSEIIRVILEFSERQGPQCAIAQFPCADRLRIAADNALFGQGNTLQDTGDALRLYKLAAARGSLIAFERMGQIYNALYFESRDRPRRRRTLNALKEGARRGNYYCFCELGVLFTAERHIGNFIKCWDLFFEHRAVAPILELEGDPGRFAAACGRYIAQALELGMQPSHRRELDNAAEAIVSALMAQLDAARGDRAARMSLTTALRWAYESMQSAPLIMGLAEQPKPAPLPKWVSERSIATAC
jgi:hypothetical protein